MSEAGVSEAAAEEPDGGGVQARAKSCASDMSMQDFLDFLHSSYQLNQTVEAAAAQPGVRTAREINWKQLLDTPTAQNRGIDNATHNDHAIAKRKLHHVLQEGLLDSVLPYLVPKNGANATPAKKLEEAQVKKPVSPGHEKPSRRGRQLDKAGRLRCRTSNAEVEIHVCDEVKGLKKTFKCPQSLLVTEMGYFAEVTAGQRLDEMDISVHCDVSNFEWLMSWVRRNQSDADSWPKLDCSNVVAVLTSAAFLQMEELLEECLKFCHTRADELLAGAANLACINDSVLTRLAGLFSNREVEALRDRKDRLQGRLFCKLIAALAEPEAAEARGHHGSLAFVFQCGECRRLVPSPALAHRIPCAPSATQIGALGELRHAHSRSSSWSLSEHVAQLKVELRTWRRVYWRLWGEAHWLHCGRCQALFCVGRASWCRLHPEPPHFIGGQRAFGKFPCCNLRVLRFTPVEAQTGCQYEDHVPDLDTEQDKAVWALFQTFRALVLETPPPLITCPEMGGDDDARPATNLKLEPTQPGHSFLPSGAWESGRSRDRGHEETSRPVRNCIQEDSDSSESSCSEESGDEGEEEKSVKSVPVKNRSRMTASTSCQSLSVAIPRHQIHCHGDRVIVETNDFRGLFGRHWDPSLSTRSNQDDQREYEERATRKITFWLSRRTNNAQHSRHAIAQQWPVGGTFVSLEREWRDQHLRQDKAPSQTKHKIRARHN